MSKLETNTIDNISGSSTLTIGDSNTSTIALKSGATLTNFPTNTPYFYGELASAQTLTRATTTKIANLTNDELDSATAFDGTTFTVPSGQGGKYYLEGVLTSNYGSIGQDGEQTISFLYKNGSEIKSAKHQQTTAGGANMNSGTVTVSGLFNLSAGDTIELYGYLQDVNGGNATAQADRTSLMGYKIIE